MIIFFFIFGLIVGSFLNSVIYRLEKKESIIKLRSYCPHCKKTLSWFELIPLVSFLLQKGKCRHCKKPISWQYPLVELATGILFVLVYNFSAQGGPAAGWQFSIFNQFPIFNFQFLTYIIFWLFVVSCLAVIFVYDLKHYIIPNEIIYPAIVLALGFRILDLFRISDLGFRILERLGPFIAAIAAGSFFLTIILVSKGKWMGMGDFKLAIFMGLILGWPKILIALLGGFLIGAFVSIILIIFKKKTLKSQIPFGPFLAGAAIVAIFWGDVLINWYFKLFLI